jgi:hypothetical protein
MDNDGRNIGQVELRYSKTCQSDWARTTVYDSCGHVNIDARVKRPYQRYPGEEYTAVEYDYTYTVNDRTCVLSKSMVTNMVYVPGTVKAQACGTIDGSAESCTKLI